MGEAEGGLGVDFEEFGGGVGGGVVEDMRSGGEVDDGIDMIEGDGWEGIGDGTYGDEFDGWEEVWGGGGGADGGADAVVVGCGYCAEVLTDESGCTSDEDVHEVVGCGDNYSICATQVKIGINL